MKYMMIILDGIQDIAYPELSGKTPLESGKGENFERFWRESATVKLATTPKGMDPDTLNCVLTLLGLEPPLIPAGRTYLESLNEDVPVGEDDLILRCSFVRVDESGVLQDPCCAPPNDVADALMKELRARNSGALKRIGTYRCLQTLPGTRRFMDGLTTHAAHNCKGRVFEDILPSGNALAQSLAKTSRELLSAYAPYSVLHWSPSYREKLPTFTELSGLKGGLVQKTMLLGGVAKLMEMISPDVPGATGECDTNLLGKAKAALDLLGSCDIALLHIGGTDEATHHQNTREKAEFITRIDSELLPLIMENCPEGCKIMLTSDHEAYCSTAGHTDLPVDAWLWEKGSVHSGDLGLIDGRDAISLLTGANW